MKRRKRHHVIERLSRIAYIQNELKSVVCKAIQKNKLVDHRTRTAAMIRNQHKLTSGQYISRHRIWCPINSSPKIASKNYRLSRFSLNQAARANEIAGLFKTGW